MTIATPAGMRTLEGRMKSATNAICSTNQASDANAVRAATACRGAIADAARPQIELAQRSFGRGVGRESRARVVHPSPFGAWPP